MEQSKELKKEFQFTVFVVSVYTSYTQQDIVLRLLEGFNKTKDEKFEVGISPESLTPVQSDVEWISVEKALPDYDTLVLWIDESGHQFVEEIDHDNDFQNFQSWNKDFDGKVIKITHWQPLPKPPKPTE